jgi:uncharacterized protein (PEP-CTERM system associated)
MSTATDPPGAFALLGAAVGGVALQFAATPAYAQPLRLDLSMEAQVVATSNANQVAGAEAQSDLLLDLHPKMRLQTQGAGLKLDLTLGMIARSYANRSLPNRAEPELDLRASAQVVEGWVSLDGSTSITSAANDPFTGQPDSRTDLRANSFRQIRGAVTPRLRRDLSPEWALQGSLAHAWQRNDDPAAVGGAGQTTHTEDTLLRLERKPVPLGVHVEFRRQRQDNEAALPDGRVLAIDALRVGTSYRVNPQFLAGLTAGRERSTYLSNDDEDSIVGLNVEWLPTERSWLRGSVEKRFFGPAYDFSLSHRSPFLAMYGSLSRQPGVAGAQIGALGSGGNVASLLDSLLTTRIPNPIERSEAVNRLITERGLPANLGQGSEVIDQTPQLVRNGTLSLVMLGVRHSLALGLFSRSAVELRREGDLSLGLSTNDFRQRGGSVLFSRRLTPTMTLSLAVDRIASEGLAAQAGDYLREWKAKAALNVSLNSRTQATFGLGRNLVRSNRAGNQQETRALIGLLQNF